MEVGERENDTKERLSHSLRCWNIKVSSQVVIFLRKPREEGDKWSERRREAGRRVIETRREGRYHRWSLFPLCLEETRYTFNTTTLISLALDGLSLSAALLRKMWIIQQEWCTAAWQRQRAHQSAIYLEKKHRERKREGEKERGARKQQAMLFSNQI